jgi:preprotein translocase subunit SecY
VSARRSRPQLAARLAHTFARVVTTAELRKKLLFTLGLIVLFRFGANLPVPGISEQNVQYCSGLASTSSSPVAGVYAMLNVLSGNALLHVAVFGVGIMPYITASIIVQLLTQVIPRLEKLKQEGQSGTAKITQYTRYLTVGLAVLVSATYVQLARSGNLFPGTGCSAANHPLVPSPTPITLVTMMVTMVSGASVVMWMGELITDRGIGNGMSVLIFTSTISVIFGQMEQSALPCGLPVDRDRDLSPASPAAGSAAGGCRWGRERRRRGRRRARRRAPGGSRSRRHAATQRSCPDRRPG